MERSAGSVNSPINIRGSSVDISINMPINISTNARGRSGDIPINLGRRRRQSGVELASPHQMSVGRSAGPIDISINIPINIPINICSVA